MPTSSELLLDDQLTVQLDTAASAAAAVEIDTIAQPVAAVESMTATAPVEPEPALVQALLPPLATVFSPPDPGPDSILVNRILQERPDVLFSYFYEHERHQGDERHAAWVKHIGADSAEGYAKYWYERNGRFEGYNQGTTTAGENIDVARVLAERPDVVNAYHRDYLDHHGWKSNAWRDVLGGNSAEDYAKYWFRNHGKGEGYTQRPVAQREATLSDAPQTERETIVDPTLTGTATSEAAAEDGYRPVPLTETNAAPMADHEPGGARSAPPEAALASISDYASAEPLVVIVGGGLAEADPFA